MATLLLRLAAPMQAWGTDSKFERRMTGREPSKSGVIGMLAAALGRGRDELVDDLTALRFGVRTDRPGQLLKDFHTAKVASEKNSRITERFYLSDAVFTVGLEGDAEFLKQLEAAILSPVYPLFLGRRSCPPVGRICLGIQDLPLEEALEGEISMDANGTTATRRRDAPKSFSQHHRKHDYRYITQHDAFEGGM